MDVEITRSKMAKQVEAARSSAMAGVLGWGFEIEDLTVYVGMSPRQGDKKSFSLRVAFDGFPRQAPSYVFVDQDSREPSDSSWPPNVKHNDKDL